jgi:RimJ/RimL family protein N-acetyltransferase
MAIVPVNLEGRFVRLEPLGPQHEPRLAAVAKAEWFDLWTRTTIVPDSPASAAAHVAGKLAWRDAGHHLAFAVVDVASGELVGGTSFGDVDLEAGHLEIGWTWYVEQARGTAVNPECKLLLLEHAFERVGVERVQLKTSSRNERSQRAIAGIGAVREGVLRRATRHRDGTWRDTVVFSILRDEWPAVRERLVLRLARFG